MEFTMSRDENHPQRIIVTGKDIEMIYYEGKVGDGLVKRSSGAVEGTLFVCDDWNWYWKKSGRGGYKDKEYKWQAIKMADQFIYDQGFDFWKK
ncbi:hypothetical protein [Bacillus mycoides]|uniref:hypothetical protein n=1 Tax=Bacillus mycoides TaxID=1405 RepID=UPI000BF4CFB5|nr:hypothetical protein [Bacillus mycoides]PGA05590.1 hypothetical protein COL71_25605 [Bacillus mycoides]